VVYDVPLLVENKLGADYHLVVVVDAHAEERLERLVQRRGMSEADVRARMAHQASDAQRAAAADVLIVNDGIEDELRAAVDELWDDRLLPFDENLRAQRRSEWRRLGVAVPYDEEWPRQAERLIGRLSRALGQRAPEIEHVGSTAVPGMPGKDVIDLQIGVSELTDADDPEFVAVLGQLGFPRLEDVRMDHPTGELLDPELWVKRYHVSCDPGRVVHIHVREADSAGWQSALLFRDWLRACPDAAAEYVAVKQRLADSTPDSRSYATAKEPWFEEVWPRITAWAQKSGWRA